MGKKQKIDAQSPPVTGDRLKTILAACAVQGEAVDVERGHLGDLFDGAKALGVDVRAAKLALRMSGWEPQAVRAFLETLDDCMIVLGLDAQGDIEDITRQRDTPRRGSGKNAGAEPDGKGGESRARPASHGPPASIN